MLPRLPPQIWEKWFEQLRCPKRLFFFGGASCYRSIFWLGVSNINCYLSMLGMIEMRWRTYFWDGLAHFRTTNQYHWVWAKCWSPKTILDWRTRLRWNHPILLDARAPEWDGVIEVSSVADKFIQRLVQLNVGGKTCFTYIDLWSQSIDHQKIPMFGGEILIFDG